MVLSRKQKEEVVAKLKVDLKKYPVFGIASLQNLPTEQFNNIKKKIRDHVKIVVVKSTLIKRAVEEARPEAKDMIQHLSGSVGVVFTDMAPFKLAKILRQNKSKISAKPGMVPDHDIVVPAGETNLAPGPVLTELKNAKIQAKIQGTKVVISKDATIAKAGAPVTPETCAIMSKLDIQPFTVGLSISGLWENGMVYSKAVLDVDDSVYVENVKIAASQALNLCVHAEIWNSISAPAIVAKAAREANALQSQMKKPGAESAAPATQ